ncbi:MAG: HD-GYP domain-containing protein [Anaerocolumna sp.]
MKTRNISIRQARPGMIVANDLYNESNQLVISKGIPLTDKIITRLKFYSIKEFPIILMDKILQPPTLTTTTSHSQMTKKSTSFKKFETAFIKSVESFKVELNKLSTNDTNVDVMGLLEHTNSILKNCRNGMHLFDMIHCMREYDDITYIHSVNVSLLCNVFGRWLKLSDEDIEAITLAGLLHDIGKLTLPQELVTKQSQLTPSEYITIKTHPLQGFNTLKGKNLDQRVINAALMHHERCDGSGYPYRLKGHEIDDFAKIVAIVDVYDAMTSNRSYRPALSPFEVIRTFESEGLQKFDPKFIMVFLNEIVQAYIGNRVVLNNKMEGEVRMINKHALARPIIQVGNDFIDLSKNYDLEIVSMV